MNKEVWCSPDGRVVWCIWTKAGIDDAIYLFKMGRLLPDGQGGGLHCKPEDEVTVIGPFDVISPHLVDGFVG
jgi:hypothetical protein